MSEMSNATSTGPIDLSSNIKYVHRFINELVYYLTSRDVSLNNSRLFASLHSTSPNSLQHNDARTFKIALLCDRDLEESRVCESLNSFRNRLQLRRIKNVNEIKNEIILKIFSTTLYIKLFFFFFFWQVLIIPNFFFIFALQKSL